MVIVSRKDNVIYISSQQILTEPIVRQSTNIY